MPISGKEMLKKFMRNGWQILRQKGSHVQIGKQGKSKFLNETIPMHKELGKRLEKSLLNRLEEE